MKTYEEFYEESIQNPAGFWKKQSEAIDWYREPTKILNSSIQNIWFEDGLLNLSYLCIDKHVHDGYGDQTAIVYDSPVTGQKQKISYLQLQDEVSRLAGGLQSLGVEKGDTVIIYMPMIPQAIYAMLACVRIGAIHSVVFGGFAPHELAIRIDDCAPKVLICADHGVEVEKIIPYKPYVDEAIELAQHKPEKVVIFDRKRGVDFETKDRDVDYASLVNEATPAEAVPVRSDHPSYILYTSGTTGKPKGIVRDTGGYATALKFTMRYVYDVEPGDTYWAASDVGWVVGHSYIVYAPLLNRNTTILFEGKPVKTPDASTFWRIVEQNKVKVLFTAPTAVRAIRKEDPNGEFIKKYDLSSLKYLFLAGERCDVSTLRWCEHQLKVPVIDHWWQTESGWPMLANMAGVGLKPIKAGSASLPVCGYKLEILNADGKKLDPNNEGFVTIRLPLPPGNLMCLWNDEDRYRNNYLSRFTGYYFSGDGGYKDKDGYVFITGRVDDVINVAGHRLSTAEMEEVIAMHPAVAECAVFGIHCEMKGQRPLGLVVQRPDVTMEFEMLQQQLVESVRKEIGPVASFKQIVVVNRLPKTRSGKILRKLLRDIADNKEYTIPSTIDDISIISEIEEAYVQHKIGIQSKFEL